MIIQWKLQYKAFLSGPLGEGGQEGLDTAQVRHTITSPGETPQQALGRRVAASRTRKSSTRLLHQWGQAKASFLQPHGGQEGRGSLQDFRGCLGDFQSRNHSQETNSADTMHWLQNIPELEKLKLTGQGSPLFLCMLTSLLLSGLGEMALLADLPLSLLCTLMALIIVPVVCCPLCS